MSKFNFVSHESFPNDEYTKEIVYFEITVPVRVAWVRKSAKNGGAFWSAASLGVTKDGAKDYFPAWMQDSNFLEKDMKAFLDARKWEGRATVTNHESLQDQKPQSMSEVTDQMEFPF